MSTKTCQAEMTTVFFATVDGATSDTISVLTTGSPSSPEGALKTHLQSTFGLKVEYIVLEMYEPGKYVVLFDTASTRFIRECSVVEATTVADKKTVQKELCAYIKRYNIREVDLNEIYSHYNITTIGVDAFHNCSSLMTIAIPDSITAIDRGAFQGCTSLTMIAIPDSVTTIGVGSFAHCTLLTMIAIPSSVTAIREFAFYCCSSLTTIDIPSSVTSIMRGAFAACTSLTTVVIPSSATAIGVSAFLDCTSLTTVAIPSSATAIGVSAFKGCTSLTLVSNQNQYINPDTPPDHL